MSTTPTDSQTTDGGFEHVKIEVVPHVPAPMFASPGEFDPTAPGSAEYEMAGTEPGEAQLTEEEVMRITKLFLTTTPNIFKRPWLATPEEDLKPFVTELTIYFNKNGIDPNEYFGEYFPVFVTALPIGAGILERHRSHKREHVEERKHEFKSSNIEHAEHTSVDRKTDPYNSTQGGDCLPEIEEPDAGGDVDGEEDI